MHGQPHIKYINTPPTLHKMNNCERFPSPSVCLDVLENYVCTLMQAYSVPLNNAISLEFTRMKSLSAPRMSNYSQLCAYKY